MSMIKDNEKVRRLAEAFYEGFIKLEIIISYCYIAYWVLNENVNDAKVIERVAKQTGIEISMELVEKASEEEKSILTKNTQEAVDRGAFGVPFYYIEPNGK